MFFSGKDWETSQDQGKKNEWSKVQKSLMKNCSRALRTSDRGKVSPSNRTTTLNEIFQFLIFYTFANISKPVFALSLWGIVCRLMREKTQL
jgi:hypothetical protein